MLERDPEVKRALEDFIQMRKEKRSPVTPTSMARMLKRLESVEKPSEVLDLSTMNGWQGIFPDRVPSMKIPTYQEIAKHAESKGFPVEWAQDFWCEQEGGGWKVKGMPIANWKPLFMVHCNRRIDSQNRRGL